ncbi:hypothetical protein HanIR_Chr17g0849551 [Helianthus annuus]|nr:hypothetical protein HanIR_Chr17g0849551 [Helianthus annuus]
MNLIEEHSRACNLCGRYLLQFSTFSDINRSFLCDAFSWINSSQPVFKVDVQVMWTHSMGLRKIN